MWKILFPCLYYSSPHKMGSNERNPHHHIYHYTSEILFFIYGSSANIVWRHSLLFCVLPCTINVTPLEKVSGSVIYGEQQKPDTQNKDDILNARFHAQYHRCYQYSNHSVPAKQSTKPYLLISLFRSAHPALPLCQKALTLRSALFM